MKPYFIKEKVIPFSRPCYDAGYKDHWLNVIIFGRCHHCEFITEHPEAFSKHKSLTTSDIPF